MHKEQLADGVVIYLADCNDIFGSLPKVDLVLTDPPYGIKQHGGRTHRKNSNARVQKKLDWDNSRPKKETFDCIHKISSNAVIWGGNYFSDYLPPKMGWFYWRKLMGGDFSDGELAWTSRSGALKEFSYKKTNFEMEHPTQKPVELLKWCIGFFDDSNLIFDPFMGVGSSGVAALRLGKKFIGVELELEYFLIAKRRILDELKAPSFFTKRPSLIK